MTRMMTPPAVLRWLAIGLLAACAGPTAAAQQPVAAKAEKPKAEHAPAASKPATARVEKGPFKVEVTLQGVFESAKMTEISLRPRAWTLPLVVERAVELGTPVKAGDILVEFDREKVERAIQDAEVEETLGSLAIKQAEEELPLLEKFLPIDLAAAERAKAQADEDLDLFVRLDRPLAEKAAHFYVRSATEYLEYAREELRQLEKMYRSKDLTEETEEIILRRTRFQVESSEFQLKEAERSRDATLKQQLPRQEIRVREAAVRQALDLQKARATLPLTLGQKRLTLAKLRHDHARTAEKLADLRRDREAMAVHAPADGLVYYGRPERGSWPGGAAAATKLHKGGVIAPDEVFITIVAPRPERIRATADEKDLGHLGVGNDLKGRAVPASNPDISLQARLSGLVSVPREAGKFDVVAELGPDSPSGSIRPGMACTLKFATYRKAEALTVPSAAVFEDESDDGTPTRVVYLAAREGKPEKRTVKVGKSSGGKAEILEGLKAGDEILKSKP